MIENIRIKDIKDPEKGCTRCCQCSDYPVTAIEWEQAGKTWINHYCCEHAKAVVGPSSQK